MHPWEQPSPADLTVPQQERFNALNGGILWTIPPGAVLVQRGDWVEILEPEPTGLMAWDMGTGATGPGMA